MRLQGPVSEGSPRNMLTVTEHFKSFKNKKTYFSDLAIVPMNIEYAFAVIELKC